jgi:hypothetical protein
MQNFFSNLILMILITGVVNPVTGSVAFGDSSVSVPPCSTNVDEGQSFDGFRRFDPNNPAAVRTPFKINQDQFSPIGTSCRTNAGIIFVRVSDSSGATGWMDTGPSGKIWYDEMGGPINRSDAKKFCRSKIDQTLPTDKDLWLAGHHGFGEVLKETRKVYAIWSETIEWPGLGKGHVFVDFDEGEIILMAQDLATNTGGADGYAIGAVCINR